MKKTRSPYCVGYGKPPKKHRWKKGMSGNPRGRPRRPKPQVPQDLREALAYALLKDQRVQLDGRETVLPRYTVFAESLTRECLASPIAQKMAFSKLLRDLRVDDRLRELNAREEHSDEMFTEEALAIIARVKADLGLR